MSRTANDQLRFVSATMSRWNQCRLLPRMMQLAAPIRLKHRERREKPRRVWPLKVFGLRRIPR